MKSDAAALVDSTSSHTEGAAAPGAPATSRPSPRSGRGALEAAAISWFVVAALGQVIFAAYVIAQYGYATVRGRFELWNKVFPPGHGYIPGDTAGNLALLLHLVLVAVVMIGGLLQLIPALRRRWPAFHRWTGRVYLGSVLIMSVGGLYLNLTRDLVGTPAQALASRINGLLIIGFAGMAYYRARTRRIDLHRRWALRLFLVASAVWFVRLGWSLWVAIHQGQVRYGQTTFTVFSYAQFLLPLFVLELYFRANDRGPRSRIAMAATLAVLTLVTAAGIAAATLRLWLPRLL